MSLTKRQRQYLSDLEAGLEPDPPARPTWWKWEQQEPFVAALQRAKRELARHSRPLAEEGLEHLREAGRIAYDTEDGRLHTTVAQLLRDWPPSEGAQNAGAMDDGPV